MGSYELVSHSDAAEEQRGHGGSDEHGGRGRNSTRRGCERRRRREDENAGGGGGDPSPKNLRAPRQASAHRLPLKVDSVVRNNKRSMEQAAQGSSAAWSSRAPRPGSTAASPAKAARMAAAAPKCKPASAPPPNGPAQAGLPELDWGEGSDGEEEGGWQVVDHAAGAAPGGAAKGGIRCEGLPGEYTSIFNNWACGDDELPDVTL